MKKIACLLMTLLFAAALAAGATEQSARDISDLVDLDPGQAIQQGKEALKESIAKGDKAGQLKALYLLSIARAAIGETINQQDEERGEQLARELGDMNALSTFIDSRAYFEWDNGRPDKANALWDEAISIAKQHHLDDSLGWIYQCKGISLLDSGHRADALVWFSKAYAIFET